MSALPAPQTEPQTIVDTAKVAVWGLVFYGASVAAGVYLAHMAMAAAALQTVIAEWGAGRIGITWSDPRAAASSWKPIAVRALRGAGLGFAAGGTAIALLLATRGATLGPTTPALGALGVGLLMSVLAAVRDELLLRGVVLRAAGSWVTPPIAIAAVALANVAARLGASGGGSLRVTEAVQAALLGAALGALWLRDRGAWLAVGANTAWLWSTGALTRGAFLDVRFAKGAWGGGDDMGRSGGATLVLAAFAVGAVAWVLRERPTKQGIVTGS